MQRKSGVTAPPSAVIDGRVLASLPCPGSRWGFFEPREKAAFLGKMGNENIRKSVVRAAVHVEPFSRSSGCRIAGNEYLSPIVPAAGYRDGDDN
jgi:hypothetical protein